MANTEGALGHGVVEHDLGLQHLSGAMTLSLAANWNQNEADWSLMLALGKGFGLSAADGTLLATTVVLPYEDKFAWVSMVLVSPEYRRQGYASHLLRSAIAYLDARKLTPLLDATPAGHEVYVQEGFRDTWKFRRYALSESRAGYPLLDVSGVNIGRLVEADWPRLLALDKPAFGASREGLLRALSARLPEAALVARRGEKLCGYLLGRDGREARELGPLIAEDPAIAQALLTHALQEVATPLYMDILDRHAGLREWAQLLGFTVQRPFTRMVYGGPDSAPGNNESVMLVAGPELG
jgi:GNAT superfamily N-acetyltransferase